MHSVKGLEKLMRSARKTNKLVRIAFALIVIRLPFILLAFILMPDVCYVHFPFALTLEGQYLIKDLTLFAATIAIAGMLDKPSSSEVRH